MIQGIESQCDNSTTGHSAAMSSVFNGFGGAGTAGNQDGKGKWRSSPESMRPIQLIRAAVAVPVTG
jgi:hypothetical protein